MNTLEIELIQECHRKIELELAGLLEEVDIRTFDQSSKEFALAMLRSKIINARQVISAFVVPEEVAGQRGLPRCSELPSGGPDAA